MFLHCGTSQGKNRNTTKLSVPIPSLLPHICLLLLRNYCVNRYHVTQYSSLIVCTCTCHRPYNLLPEIDKLTCLEYFSSIVKSECSNQQHRAMYQKHYMWTDSLPLIRMLYKDTYLSLFLIINVWHCEGLHLSVPFYTNIEIRITLRTPRRFFIDCSMVASKSLYEVSATTFYTKQDTVSLTGTNEHSQYHSMA